jgi:hypothetical protein
VVIDDGSAGEMDHRTPFNAPGLRWRPADGAGDDQRRECGKGADDEAEREAHGCLDPWPRPLLGPHSGVQSQLLATTSHTPGLSLIRWADTVGARD